jgi:hypothetical protein
LELDSRAWVSRFELKLNTAFHQIFHQIEVDIKLVSQLTANTLVNCASLLRRCETNTLIRKHAIFHQIFHQIEVDIDRYIQPDVQLTSDPLLSLVLSLEKPCHLAVGQ